MRRTTILAVLLATGLLASAAVAAVRFAHHPECHEPRCAWEADRAYALKHRPRFSMTRFELCIANRENGEPGATAASLVHWHAHNAYEGAFSWEPAKWKAGGGLRFARHAYEATPEQQVRVFRQNGRNGEWTLSNWPTIAACR